MKEIYYVIYNTVNKINGYNYIGKHISNKKGFSIGRKEAQN